MMMMMMIMTTVERMGWNKEWSFVSNCIVMVNK